MTYLLAGLVALLVGTNITLMVWWRGANKGKDAAEDRAVAEREQRVQAQEDLRDADATIKTKTAENLILKQRLEAAETERDRAYADARDHLVEELRTANLADAAVFVARLIAQPIHGGVLPKGRLSDDPRDGLIDPDA